MKYLYVFSLIFIFFSCGNYSFSGKSIPPGIKNAQLLIFEDNSGRYDLNLPSILNEKITDKIEDYNYFVLENSSNAHSKIFGTVRSYSEKFSSQSRDEIADQMTITVSVEVNFYDNINSDFIVKSLNVTESEYYEAAGGDTAREEAFEILIDRLSENIVLGLSSNW